MFKVGKIIYNRFDNTFDSLTIHSCKLHPHNCCSTTVFEMIETSVILRQFCGHPCNRQYEISKHILSIITPISFNSSSLAWNNPSIDLQPTPGLKINFNNFKRSLLYCCNWYRIKNKLWRCCVKPLICACGVGLLTQLYMKC